MGGKNSLSMKELVAILEHLGGKHVRTYIQSGNAVFQSAAGNLARLSRQLSAEINARHGFEPHALLIELQELDAAMAGNPFPEGELAPSSLHLGFLASTPRNPNLEKLNTLKKPSERFHLGDKVFYLSAPEGVGNSRLAASSEKLLGVAMTDRNWRTVCKIRELAGA